MNRPINVLVACECSGRVKAAFRKRGFNAWSCDLKPSEIPDDKFHIQGDVLAHLNDGWDLMIAHPPCTYLAASGSRWLYDIRYPNRKADQKEASKFFLSLYHSNISYVAIENPSGVMSSIFRKPDQIIQPYFFGDEAQKTTCLWLKGLPKLRYGQEVQMAFGESQPPTSKLVSKGKMHITKGGKVIPEWYSMLAVSSDRQALRSVTFQGIANAMAEQWGDFLTKSQE